MVRLNGIKYTKMDYIEQSAHLFFKRYIGHPDRISSPGPVIDAYSNKICEFFTSSDKIHFTTIILEEVNINHELHLMKCKEINECRVNFSYNAIIYHLQSKLEELGISTNIDHFTLSEKETYTSGIENLKDEIRLLELGQEIIYDDIMAEFEEQKNYFFLGKKTWKQLLIGKMVSIFGNSLAEQLMKKLFEKFFNNDFTKLIGGLKP